MYVEFYLICTRIKFFGLAVVTVVHVTLRCMSMWVHPGVTWQDVMRQIGLVGLDLSLVTVTLYDSQGRVDGSIRLAMSYSVHQQMLGCRVWVSLKLSCILPFTVAAIGPSKE